MCSAINSIHCQRCKIYIVHTYSINAHTLRIATEVDVIVHPSLGTALLSGLPCVCLLHRPCADSYVYRFLVPHFTDTWCHWTGRCPVRTCLLPLLHKSEDTCLTACNYSSPVHCNGGGGRTLHWSIAIFSSMSRSQSVWHSPSLLRQYLAFVLSPSRWSWRTDRSRPHERKSCSMVGASVAPSTIKLWGERSSLVSPQSLYLHLHNTNEITTNNPKCTLHVWESRLWLLRLLISQLNA